LPPSIAEVSASFDIHGRADQTLLQTWRIPADSAGVLEADQVIEPVDLGQGVGG
jgi:hypothetical protein